MTTATAEKVFGWKNVHKHDGELIGKKQDKLGRWRIAKVPEYANDPVQAYAIDERMKQLGLSARYIKKGFPGLPKPRIFPASGPRPSSEVERRSKTLEKSLD